MKNKDHLLQEFGKRLKAERAMRGLTQQALAKKAYTKQDYIAQIERGARSPSLRTLMNILLALDVSADYLLYGANKEQGCESTLIIDKFISFLSSRNIGEIKSYYEIVKFLSTYIERNNSH